MMPLLQTSGKGTCFACFNAWYATGLTQVCRSFTVKVTPGVPGDHRYACLITLSQSMGFNGMVMEDMLGHTSNCCTIETNKLQFSDTGLS